jgi:hypothetical protein
VVLGDGLMAVWTLQVGLSDTRTADVVPAEPTLTGEPISPYKYTSIPDMYAPQHVLSYPACARPVSQVWSQHDSCTGRTAMTGDSTI